MRLGFFLREAIRALKRNAVPSFAAMATVVVTVFLLGVFIPVVQTTNGAANTIRSRVVTDVFLKTDSTKLDIARVRHLLEKETKHVKKIEFISKTQAYQQEKKKNPELYRLLGSENPFPDFFRITPDDPGNISQLREALMPKSPSGKRTVIDTSIDEIRNHGTGAKQIVSRTNLIKWTMGILTTLLVIASVLLIANTIRLSLYARRREVEVMKLVGATDWFIRWPFVLEGILVGAIGAVVAVVMLGILKIVLIDPRSNEFVLTSSSNTLSFGPLAILLLASAVIVSALGSGLSLRRFLRV